MMRKDKALARRERDLFYTSNFGKTWTKVHDAMTSYNLRWTPFPDEHPDVSPILDTRSMDLFNIFAIIVYYLLLPLPCH
jgi:hypothetical protein